MENTTRGILLGTVGSLALATLASEAGAVDYEVGPGQTYANITDVPLGSLQPGDNVLIHWQADPYRETFGIDRAGTAEQPITIRGVPNAQGVLPAIDGESSSSGYGSHSRGLIHVSGDAAYVVVENLELRNAHADYGFSDNASSVYAPEGSHLTFRNLDIHHSGNGFFTWVYSSSVLVEGCYIHDNGNVGSIYEHNIYTESNGIVFQYNRIMPLMSGASGNNLKDRSTGLVVRYNWIEGGNRVLDLVESQDGSWDHTEGPEFVYGNVLIKHDDTGQSQVVHFGGDDPSRSDRTFLYFYHNTVYSDRPDGTTLFFVNAAAEVDARNNIFFGPNATVELIDPDDSSEATLELGNNWISSGYAVGSSQATVNGEGNLITGSDPGLASVPTDFTPTSGSPPVDAGTALSSGVDAYPVDREYLDQGTSRARNDSGDPDLGAYALESAGGATGSGGSGAAGSGGAAGEAAGGSGGATSGGSAGAATAGSAGAPAGGSAGTAAGGTAAGGSAGTAAGGAAAGGSAGTEVAGASGNPPVGAGGTSSGGAAFGGE